MTIMCEFDTLSDTNEVLNDIWQVIESSFVQMTSSQASLSPTQYLYLLRQLLNNIHGLFSGVYRERQFCWMLFKGLLVENSQIKHFIENVICSTEVIMSNEQGIAVEEKIMLSKAILKLLREITDEQDGRIDY